MYNFDSLLVISYYCAVSEEHTGGNNELDVYIDLLTIIIISGSMDIYIMIR